MVLIAKEFAPVTYRFGFIEAPFLSVCEAWGNWSRSLDAKFALSTEFRMIRAPLSTALHALEPLTTPLNRYLIVETGSQWTAVFANGLRGNDVTSPVSYLPRVLNCRGLEVGAAPDRSKSKRKDLIRLWGHVLFDMYGPEQTDWLNRIRAVQVWNDVGGWNFSQSGAVQQFEEPDAYKKRKIQDRFTVEMLERYCRALGIELNQERFYRPTSCAVNTTGQKFRGEVSMSIAEANAHLNLSFVP